jgi:hypothetical protein
MKVEGSYSRNYLFNIMFILKVFTIFAFQTFYNLLQCLKFYIGQLAWLRYFALGSASFHLAPFFKSAPKIHTQICSVLLFCGDEYSAPLCSGAKQLGSGRQ